MIASESQEAESQEGHSTFQVAVVCGGSEGKFRVLVLLRFSAASESRRTVCHVQDYAAATGVRLPFPLH